ncbi:MAG TPA: HEAT repeat domain-containing protein, partial [Candidatus Hydrogenedentes bacterium]|nr:HEAT repeat domain-containing protein [Candidatus Hydrogenedentota bacterium]
MTCVAPLLLCLLAEFPAELADTPPTGPPETESPAATWKQRAVGGAVARIHELSGPSGIHWPRGEAAAAGSDLRGGAGPDNAVIRAMFAAPEPSTRVRAVELWVTTPEPGPPDLLLAALEDPDRTVRAAAARALGRLDVATLTEQVLDALRDPLSPGAQTIHQVLPEMQDVIERPLIEVLEDDAAPSERRWAAGYALGGMGSARAAPTLARLTASPDFVLARVCAEALVKSRAPQDVGFWIGVASHP